MSTPPCRSCGAPLRHVVIDLGRQPLSNAYLRPDQVAEEQLHPLIARFCDRCALVQVDEVVAASDIFEAYAYFSSYSESWVRHAAAFVEQAVEARGLGSDSLVVEIASNDGYLLRHLVERGIPVLGVEPAKNVAEVAVDHGVPTLVEFFGLSVARRIVDEHGVADLVVANNVMAHVPDLNDFVAGLAELVADDGAVSIEVPHLLRLVEGVQFDTIYHEHYSYFSLLAARSVLERHGLAVTHVEELTTHGGSLRITAQPASAGRTPSARVEQVLAEERLAGLDSIDGFAHFADASARCRDSLVEFVSEARSEGRRIVGYGAAAKGNTLLNYAGLGPDDIGYVADLSPHKQGHLLPGSHIPVVEPDRIRADRPPYVLILPWNLRDEITEQMADVHDWGGRFVTAVPRVEVEA